MKYWSKDGMTDGIILKSMSEYEDCVMFKVLDDKVLFSCYTEEETDIYFKTKQEAIEMLQEAIDFLQVEQ